MMDMENANDVAAVDEEYRQAIRNAKKIEEYWRTRGEEINVSVSPENTPRGVVWAIHTDLQGNGLPEKVSEAMKSQRLVKARAEKRSLFVPWPPSTNSLYRNLAGRGRVKTKAYGQWIEFAGKLLMTQNTKAYTGPVKIKIKATPPNKRLFDLDNKLKPLLDLLTSHGIITDDNCKVVKGIEITLEDGRPGLEIFITDVPE